MHYRIRIRIRLEFSSQKMWCLNIKFSLFFRKIQKQRCAYLEGKC